MRRAVSDARPAGAQDADFYPPLPGGNSGRNGGRFTGRIGKEPPKPKGYRSSSLSSIARLAPQSQHAEASSAGPKQQPPKTRLLTPAEITAKFSDLQAAPRVLALQDVAATAPSRKPGPSTPGPTTHAKPGDRHDHPRVESLPLGPSSLEERASRASAGPDRDRGDSRWSQEAAACAVAAPVDGGGGASRVAAKGEQEGLGLSDGEMFFLLEDMFGGLLLPESLEKVFRESGNDLEKVSHCARPPLFHYGSCFKERGR